MIPASLKTIIELFLSFSRRFGVVTIENCGTQLKRDLKLQISDLRRLMKQIKNYWRKKIGKGTVPWSRAVQVVEETFCN